MAISSTLDKTAGAVLIVVLILIPVVSHAGGLGIAPLIFILGLMGLVLHLKSGTKKIPRSPVFWCFLIFLLWLSLTSLWSPYRPDDLLTNYIKLLIMGLVYFFSVVVFRRVAITRMVKLQRIFIITTFLSALMVALDVVFNFKITLFFNPASTAEELASRIIDTEQNLGHAITVLVLLSAPLVLMLKMHYQRWKTLSALFFVMVLIASVQNHLWIGIVGTPILILTIALAFRFPKTIPKLAVFLVIAMIIFAPLLAFISSELIKGDLSQIPGSWEHRLQMWAYCWPVIIENPLVGTGFDAVRTFDDQWTARNGIEISTVSLHPHNAGIHIWTEAGLIGCALAIGFILMCIKLVDKYTKKRDGAVLISGVIIGALLISSFTYGAWQFWWWAAIFFAVGLIHLVPNECTNNA